MPRGKIQMSLIGDAQDRVRTFRRRKAGLVKKAQELAKLCDIDVAVVVDGGGGGAAVWESSPGVVIDRYRRLPAEKRAAHTHLGYLDGELRKETRRLAKTRRREEPLGKALLACPGEAALEGMDLEKLLASIDAALLATAERQKALGIVAAADDGGHGQQQVMPADAVVVAQGGGGGPPPFAGGGDDLDDIQAWVDELTWDGVEPLPLNAGVMQCSNGASDNVDDMGGNYQCQAQMMPPGDGQLPWHAYYHPAETAVSFLDDGFQCTGNNYGNDMDGYSEMPVQSNASAAYGTWYDQASWGAAESSYAAAAAAAYPSLDIVCNAAYYMPSQHEHPSTGIGSFMDAGGHGYEMGCYLQGLDASQQHFGGEQEAVHYLSDMVQGIRYNDDHLQAGGCSSGAAQLFAQSHGCSGFGTLQFSGSEESLSDVGYQYQDPGVQHFWEMQGTPPGSTDVATASATGGGGGTWANTNSREFYQPWISVYQ